MSEPGTPEARDRFAVAARPFAFAAVLALAFMVLITTAAVFARWLFKQEIFGVVTTGAENDLEMVTRIARSMVGRWGMSERIGTLSVLPAEGDPRMAGVSDGLLDAVDEEVRRITDECYAEARRLLREHRAKLDAIVAQLLEHENLDEPEIYAAAGIERPPATLPLPPVPA